MNIKYIDYKDEAMDASTENDKAPSYGFSLSHFHSVNFHFQFSI
jgi:hypothetical protein